MRSVASSNQDYSLCGVPLQVLHLNDLRSSAGLQTAQQAQAAGKLRLVTTNRLVDYLLSSAFRLQSPEQLSTEEVARLHSRFCYACQLASWMLDEALLADQQLLAALLNQIASLKGRGLILWLRAFIPFLPRCCLPRNVSILAELVQIAWRRLTLPTPAAPLGRLALWW
jgi:hypothetical protein